MPLDILHSWHETVVSACSANHLQEKAAPLNYVVSACLQRMDPHYFRERATYNRKQAIYVGRDFLKAPKDVLYAAASGQLTISDEVFALAEEAAERALHTAIAGTASASQDCSDRPCVRAEKSVLDQCERCRAGGRALARSPKNMRYPPFVIGCTCHFSFDWESEPTEEAEFEAELQQWAAMHAAQVPSHFPARLVLFRLAGCRPEQAI